MKRSIETVQGSDVYPAAQQMLIYQGKVLKDGTTLIENNVAENSFVVIMLSKVNCFHCYVVNYNHAYLVHVLYISLWYKSFLKVRDQDNSLYPLWFLCHFVIV